MTPTTGALTPELTVLVLAALWQTIQFVIYSAAANLQVGSRYALSPRDEPRTLTGFAGRAQRTLGNTFEALILFTIAVTALTLAERTNAVTAIAAWAFLAARIAYLPAYLFGWVPWRSAIWMVGWLATLILLVAALVP